MKKSLKITALLLIFLIVPSCISFRIVPSYPLEGHVERMLFCESVDASGELLEPVEIRSDFTESDDRVVCFVEIKNINKRIGMRWKWYGPDSVLSRDSGHVIINSEERLLEVVTAYDELRLGIRETERKVGQWTVIVLIDGLLVARRTFEVSEFSF